MPTLRMGAAGVDGNTAKDIKASGQQGCIALHKLLLCIWEEEVIPLDWRVAMMIALHKKGLRQICDNYRGITLLVVASKVYPKVLLRRITPTVESRLGEAQCGRPGRGTIDAIFVLRMLFQKAWAAHRSVHCGLSQLVLSGGQVENVDAFPYLGSILAADSVGKGLQARIKKACDVFAVLKHHVWKRGGDLTIRLKMRLFNAAVMSTLLYGAETWPVHERHLRRLEAFQCRCVRSLVDMPRIK